MGLGRQHISYGPLETGHAENCLLDLQFPYNYKSKSLSSDNGETDTNASVVTKLRQNPMLKGIFCHEERRNPARKIKHVLAQGVFAP